MSVSKPDPVDEIIKNNPHVDPEQLREAQELIKGLRSGGATGASYEILSPYERRPLHKSKSPALPEI